MARQNEYGKFIISAGEIGAYTVCPEAWRLSNVEGVRTRSSKDRIKKGNEMHREWAQKYDDAVYFGRHVKLIVFLLIATVAIFLMSLL